MYTGESFGFPMRRDAIRPIKLEETIYAQSTSVGKAAIAVVRVSGSECTSILARLCPGAAFEDRKAKLVSLRAWDQELLDRAIVLKFSAPRSYTGEDMLEFHVTGSRAVVAGLIRSLADAHGTRPAEPGEFAKRAFDNGKLDLVEVEGLSAVLAAETEAQLRHATRMASGSVSRECIQIRSLLLATMAYLESLLDFSDVEDAALHSRDALRTQVEEVKSRICAMLKYSGVSERLRDGMIVVITGAPNVGKSTFLNNVAKREVAIVSPIPGTTRDSLEVATEVGGFPVTFIDTAGIRDSADVLEQQGVARALEKGENADLILWLFDQAGASRPVSPMARPTVRVRTKIDLGDAKPDESDVLKISAKAGIGIERLLAVIGDFAKKHFEGSGSLVFASERQRSAARRALEGIERCLDDPELALELIAEELRGSAQALARVTERIGVEEILTEVFAHLCVGK